MSDIDEVRESLHGSIQTTMGDDPTVPDGVMLMGFVVVAEWMAPDGRRWLSIADGDARAEGLAVWQRQGYLHNALFDPEGFIPDDEDDDDG